MLVKTPITTEIAALRNVSLQVEPGEVCALVGPNGAGKTTLFRILVGLITQTSGEARVLGHDVITESLSVRRRVGWMPTSEQTLFHRHTSAENLRFHGRLHGLKGSRLETAINETLDLVGLGYAGDNAVVSFSAGMRARLQLARALLHKPQLLILDEPTASVDPVASYELINLILAIVRETSVSAIVSSHRLDEIEALGSHVVLLHKGRVLFDGVLDDLRARLGKPHYELRFNSAEASDRAVARLKESAMVDGVEVTAKNAVRAMLHHGARIGTLLTRLNGELEDLDGISEVSMPLREVLAEVYGVGHYQSDGGQ